MKRCLGLLVLGLVLSAQPAAAQVCQWCKRGGKDITWVKLFWYKWDKESKPPRLVDLDKESIYKAYKGVPDKKRHKIDPVLLREWVPEIFEPVGSKKKAEAYYFICRYHFDGEKAGDVGESGLPLDQGRPHEKGEHCTASEDGKPCQRMGFRQFNKVRSAELKDAQWLCPVHLAAADKQQKQMPLLIFGGVAAVLLLGLGLGVVGIKIGDKERALDESGGGKKR